jgi:uncharacterized protein
MNTPSWEEILQIFHQQDYQRAYPLVLSFAQVGHREAQEIMGNFYQLGFCGEMNYAKAQEWYEKAIAQGSGLAANNLATIYRMGDESVQVDRAKAEELRQKAIELGFEHAPRSLT